MSNEVELDFGDEAWAQDQLTKLVDQSGSLATSLEDLRPLLYGNPEDQERALERLVTLILKLPSDFLAKDQINLLLSFLLDRLDSSGLAAGRVIDAVRHLLMESSNTGSEEAILAWKSLFHEGNLQAWSVSQRLALYEILEWLCKLTSATMPLGSEFVLSFVKSVGGERDPRCLTMAFRLFIVVATQWNLGPFVEEMFEVVACYYPIQFKPKGDESITRESLSVQCEACLLAHPGFAPFCLLMIEEKLTEEGMDMTTRGAICRFMSLAVTVFPAASIPNHAEALLGALRAVTFDPNDKYGENAPLAAEATKAMVERMYQLDGKYLDGAIDLTLENIEPFVLQAEMGLSLRAFALLETLCPSPQPIMVTSSAEIMVTSSAEIMVTSSEEASGDRIEYVTPRKSVQGLVSRAIGWSLALIQGETTNTAANKADVCRDGLTAIVQWITVARRVRCDDAVVCVRSTILDAIDAVRPLVGKEAVITAYKAAALMVNLPCKSEEEEEGEGYGELLKRGLYTEEKSPEEQEAFLSFVTQHSIHRWNEHEAILSQTTPLGEEADPFAVNRVQVACASVHNEDSWNVMKKRIWNDMEVVSEEGATALLSLARSERGRSTVGVDRLAREFKDFIVDRLPRDELIRLSSHVEVWQQWGTIVSDECHASLVDDIFRLLEDESSIERQWMKTAIAHLFVLFVVQAKDDNAVYRMISLIVASRVESTAELRRILYFAQVNRFGEESMGALSIAHMAEKDEAELVRLRIEGVKANLIVGRGRRGVEEAHELLSSLTTTTDPSVSIGHLLDFSSPLYDSNANRLNASMLWRQRIAYQLVPVFEQEVNEATSREWRITLLSSLRHLVKLTSTEGESDASLLAPLLDTVVYSLVDVATSFASSSSSSSSTMTSSLPESTLFLVQSLEQLIGCTEKEKLKKEKVAAIAQALCLLVENRNTPSALIFSCISCMRSLLTSSPSTSCQPSITRVVRALAKAAGHGKRAIRVSAADTRNRWELLSTM